MSRDPYTGRETDWLSVFKGRPFLIALWRNQFETPKRIRTWQKAWDRSGIAAISNAIANGDWYDPIDIPIINDAEPTE